ncbi:MAG: hypothetical protein R3F28_03285 [Candidatus Kapaibacterium sp.]
MREQRHASRRSTTARTSIVVTQFEDVSRGGIAVSFESNSDRENRIDGVHNDWVTRSITGADAKGTERVQQRTSVMRLVSR